MRLPTLADIEAVTALVRSVVPPTPAYAWPLLERRLDTRVWVKHENHGPTGAFKVRGGLVYLDRLRAREPRCAGVISATRGNHGQSIALAARRVGIAATIVVPVGNSREKNAAMRALGATLVEHGDDFEASRQHAVALAAARGLHMVPSFHADLVAGVATYWVELFRAVPALEVAYVPIGLGSGASAAIAARDALGVRCAIRGVVSTLAPAYARSLEAGRPVEAPASTRYADGMACRAADAAALEVLRAGLDEVVMVDDDEVAAAMKTYFVDTHNVAEGAGAAPLAAAWQQRRALAGRRVALALTGGNVDHDLYAEALAHAALADDATARDPRAAATRG